MQQVHWKMLERTAEVLLVECFARCNLVSLCRKEHLANLPLKSILMLHNAYNKCIYNETMHCWRWNSNSAFITHRCIFIMYIIVNHKLVPFGQLRNSKLSRRKSVATVNFVDFIGWVVDPVLIIAFNASCKASFLPSCIDVRKLRTCQAFNYQCWQVCASNVEEQAFYRATNEAREKAVSIILWWCWRGSSRSFLCKRHSPSDSIGQMYCWWRQLTVRR